MVNVALEMTKNDRAVRVIILECTDLPPFARAIQRTTNLPVFDIVTLVNLLHAAVLRGQF